MVSRTHIEPAEGQIQRIVGNRIKDQALIGTLIGRRYPFATGTITALLKRAWNLEHDMEVHTIGNNLYFILFDDIGDKSKVLSVGPWSVMDNLLVLQGWPQHEPSELEYLYFMHFSLTDLYVQVHGLDERVVFFRYERLPLFCHACGILGHSRETCWLLADPSQIDYYGDWLRADNDAGEKGNVVGANGRWEVNIQTYEWSEAIRRLEGSITEIRPGVWSFPFEINDVTIDSINDLLEDRSYGYRLYSRIIQRIESEVRGRSCMGGRLQYFHSLKKAGLKFAEFEELRLQELKGFQEHTLNPFYKSVEADLSIMQVQSFGGVSRRFDLELANSGYFTMLL